MCRRFARLHLRRLRLPTLARAAATKAAATINEDRGLPSPATQRAIGRYGTHWATVDVAKQLALKGCGGAGIGCKVFWTTQDKCVAYAHSKKGGYWYAGGGGTSDQQAKQNAIKFCQSGSAPPNSCVIAVAECR